MSIFTYKLATYLSAGDVAGLQNAIFRVSCWVRRVCSGIPWLYRLSVSLWLYVASWYVCLCVCMWIRIWVKSRVTWLWKRSRLHIVRQECCCYRQQSCVNSTAAAVVGLHVDMTVQMSSLYVAGVETRLGETRVGSQPQAWWPTSRAAYADTSKSGRLRHRQSRR